MPSGILMRVKTVLMLNSNPDIKNKANTKRIIACCFFVTEPEEDVPAISIISGRADWTNDLVEARKTPSSSSSDKREECSKSEEEIELSESESDSTIFLLLLLYDCFLFSCRLWGYLSLRTTES